MSVSHKTAVRLVRKLGENHDMEVLQWKSLSEGRVLGPKRSAVSSAETGSSEDSDDESRPLAVPLPPDPHPREPTYVIVGDNLDRNVSPRDMRVDHQVKSVHHFNMYAVHDRVDVSNLPGDNQVGDVRNLPFTAFLPSPADCSDIRNNYITLAARVVVEKLPHFSKLRKCVPTHIQHRFSNNMAEKSSAVS